jgi:hypothetical protein
MKNITTITLIILVLLLGGFLAANFMPKGKDLSFYLPATLAPTENSVYVQASIDARMEPYIVALGPTEENSLDFEVVSMQGDYYDAEGRMAMTIIAQEIDKNQMDTYKEKAWERFSEPTRGGRFEKEFINGYDVYISFRDIAEEEDTSGMFILGSGYIFIPDKNVVLTYSMFNTRLYACENYNDPTTCLHDQDKPLPTYDDAKKVAEAISTVINTQ